MTEPLEIVRELNRRILTFGREELARENASDFPVVRLIQGRHARHLVDSFRRRTPAEREQLVQVLPKRFWGEPWYQPELTPEDQEVVNRYRREALVFETGGPRLAAPPRTPRPNRPALRRALRDALLPVLGAPDRERSSSTDLWYGHAIGGWTVDTDIDLTGHTAITYSHIIRARDRDLLVALSPLAWLGVASETYWDALSDADVPAAAQALAHMCSAFFDRAPSLLSGLEPPEHRPRRPNPD